MPRGIIKGITFGPASVRLSLLPDYYFFFGRGHSMTPRCSCCHFSMWTWIHSDPRWNWKTYTISRPCRPAAWVYSTNVSNCWANQLFTHRTRERPRGPRLPPPSTVITPWSATQTAQSGVCLSGTEAVAHPRERLTCNWPTYKQ